jgi:hypothetical protein
VNLYLFSNVVIIGYLELYRLNRLLILRHYGRFASRMSFVEVTEFGDVPRGGGVSSAGSYGIDLSKVRADVHISADGKAFGRATDAACLGAPVERLKP